MEPINTFLFENTEVSGTTHVEEISKQQQFVLVLEMVENGHESNG